ncbi:hypothetical protein N5P37_004791 [Trichoderma harzianum]|uniref:Flavin reductase like domain-containing protein n=1 Tax=Trichoderma harzianum CBS 226.95 TaxID=983964 RepID=A0A2T3ZUZ1_TRIHA|nr:hypothetical protein M431DRAFT_99546 [Trichoderma harzianum CBS 226.95]KAK0761991.1 hypothetical protein N5P37_004791 [Trichoderma harzianum]PKK41336.1 hypothetical protein CI102_15084 [Trichoderma harzianum]PTB48626.1 hypothetical protein M431DRAFT_99546 [Trichoderma harzianum CBS 226.95]
MSTPPTSTISPPIYYWGTPVVLITTENEDGTFNIAPMSSAWWLGNRCMLGLGADSQSTINLIRTKQCVINMADDTMVGAVNALAMTTGSKAVTTATEDMGYLYFKRNKFSRAGLTPTASNVVRLPRIAECPAQMEAELKGVYDMMGDMDIRGFISLEVMVLQTHVHESIRWDGYSNRIDPDKWHPLIMSFAQFYGLKYNKTTQSTMAQIDEEAYRPFANAVDETTTMEEV